MPEVVLYFEVKLYPAFRRRPFQIVLPLRQMAVKESPKPGCCAELQRPVGTGLRLKPPLSEIIRAWRYYNAGGDFKRRQEGFAVRIPVQLEAIPRLEPNIDRRHEIFP